MADTTKPLTESAILEMTQQMDIAKILSGGAKSLNPNDVDVTELNPDDEDFNELYEKYKALAAFRTNNDYTNDKTNPTHLIS